MIRGSRAAVVAAALLLGGLGCSSYRYMREPSQELDNSRQEYVRNNPGNRYNEEIALGRVRKGMSRLQVRVTWGDPDQVAARIPGTEVWAYQEFEPSRGTNIYRLHFEGELLTGIDVERANAPLTTDAERAAEQQRDRSETRTETGKKPGAR